MRRTTKLEQVEEAIRGMMRYSEKQYDIAEEFAEKQFWGGKVNAYEMALRTIRNIQLGSKRA